VILHPLEVSAIQDADRLIQSSVFTGQVDTRRNNTKSQTCEVSEVLNCICWLPMRFFPRQDGKSFAEFLLDGKKNNDQEKK